VWVGIGVVLTVTYAVVTGAEAISGLKVVLIGGIVICVAGLKLLE
jgi:quaternary ammonium compound-resistance protein SugE